MNQSNQLIPFNNDEEKQNQLILFQNDKTIKTNIVNDTMNNKTLTNKANARWAKFSQLLPIDKHIDGLIRYVNTDEQRQALQQIATLYKGGCTDHEQWAKAACFRSKRYYCHKTRESEAACMAAAAMANWAALYWLNAPSSNIADNYAYYAGNCIRSAQCYFRDTGLFGWIIKNEPYVFVPKEVERLLNAYRICRDS